MRTCALCKETARALCESDQASLCWSCDAKVHGANFLVARHSRTLLCHTCQTPTPWRAAGPKLGHTVSFCDTCVGRSGSGDLEEGGGDNDDDDDEDRSDGDGGDDEDGEDREEEEEDGAEEGDNQVVPWSSGNPPPPASCSSSEEEELAGRSCCGGGREVDEVRMCSSLKRTVEDSVDPPSQELIQPIRWQASASTTTTVKARSGDSAAAASICSSRPAKDRRIGPVEFSTCPDWTDDL